MMVVIPLLLVIVFGEVSYGLGVQQTVQLLLAFNLKFVHAASDDCVPRDVKNTIKQCWAKQGQQIWDSCAGNNGNSHHNRGRGHYNEVSYEAMENISSCIGSTLLNLTELSAREMIELGNSMLSKEGLSKCAGQSITLPMLLCSRPKTSMSGQHDSYPLYPRIYFD